MFKNIISMPKTKYLGFGLMIPWEDNLEIQFNLWKDAFTTGKIDKLKEVCGSEQVVGIFYLTVVRLSIYKYITLFIPSVNPFISIKNHCRFYSLQWFFISS